MSPKEYVELGVGAAVGLITVKWLLAFFKWQSAMLVNRSMEPLEETVKEFRTFVGNHMEHQASEHKAILDSQKLQLGVLRDIRDKKGD